MVALSTASQMGLAFMFAGMCDTRLAFLHISAHAIFKSLLFWGVGVLNHVINHQYTVAFKVMLGLYARLVVVVAALALLGTPFLSGFYSKEAILCDTVAVRTCFLFVAACQFISVLYTCRLVWL